MYKRDRAALGRGKSLERAGGGAGERAGIKVGMSDGRAMELEIGGQGRSRSGLSVVTGEQRLNLERRRWLGIWRLLRKVGQEAAKWEGQQRQSSSVFLMPGWALGPESPPGDLGLQEALNSGIWSACAYACHCARVRVVSAPVGSALGCGT